jgi:hypothetical protein
MITGNKAFDPFTPSLRAVEADEAIHLSCFLLTGKYVCGCPSAHPAATESSKKFKKHQFLDTPHFVAFCL